jgi:probable F420-dependent oxidoreductase
MPQPALKRVRLGLAVEGSIFPLDQQHRLLEVARLADEAGVDDIVLPEHVLVGSHASQQDPWSTWEPHHLDMPWAEPLVTLAAMGAVTGRVRLVAGAVIAPLRPAALLAKMAATVHALSRGRFVLGVTPSWHRQEYEALGVDFASRGQIMEDAVGACRALWAEAPASFHSPTVSFDDMYCQPRPGPGERIPVWFTGKFTPRLVRRLVAVGDGWMPYEAHSMTLGEKAAAIAQLRQQFEAAGRDPASLEVCDRLPAVDGSLARTLEQAPAYAAAGIGTVRVALRSFVKEPADIPRAIEEIVRRFESSHPSSDGGP